LCCGAAAAFEVPGSTPRALPPDSGPDFRLSGWLLWVPSKPRRETRFDARLVTLDSSAVSSVTAIHKCGSAADGRFHADFKANSRVFSAFAGERSIRTSTDLRRMIKVGNSNRPPLLSQRKQSARVGQLLGNYKRAISPANHHSRAAAACYSRSPHIRTVRTLTELLGAEHRLPPAHIAQNANAPVRQTPSTHRHKVSSTTHNVTTKLDHTRKHR
jgi:hypothetical protein